MPPTSTSARSHDSETAFSLVELLVVLVVVAIIGATATMALSGSKERGGAITGNSTARALGEGIEQFQRDHGGRLPTIPGTADWGGGWLSPVDLGNGDKPYVRTGAVEVLADHAVSLEDASGTTGPNPSSTARIRYVVTADGLYALVVRTRNGVGFRARCYVSNADTRTTAGAAFITSTGAPREC